MAERHIGVMKSLASPSSIAVSPRPLLVTAGPLDARAGGLMLLLCCLWGLQQVSLKAVAEQASPMLMIALRSGIALLLLGALMRWRGEVLDRRRWRAGAVAGSLFALEFLLVAAALQLTQASHVVVFLYTSPLFTALGLHVCLPAERLGGRGWAGIGLAFGGIALAFLEGGAAQGGRALLGDLLAVMAGLAMGATTVTIRCTRLADAPATETLFYQLLGAFLLLLPAAWLTGQWRFEPTAIVWAHLGFQSVVVSFASFLAWFWLLRRYLASRLGAFTFLTPLFGVLLGAWLLDERLQASFVCGAALVLAGIAVVSRARV
jgi:drug/metabolite transporter (DMT)-like permease